MKIRALDFDTEVHEERVMYFEAGEQTPLTVGLDQLEEQVQAFYMSVKENKTRLKVVP